MNIRLHAVTLNIYAEVGRERRVRGTLDLLVVLALDGAGVARGGGHDVAFDEAHGALRAELRLAGQVLAVADVLGLAAAVEAVIDLGRGAGRELHDGALRGGGRLTALDQRRDRHTVVAREQLELVHARHLRTAAIGRDGRFADVQQARDVDLLLAVALHEPLQIRGENVLVVYDVVHVAPQFLHYYNKCGLVCVLVHL